MSLPSTIVLGSNFTTFAATEMLMDKSEVLAFLDSEIHRLTQARELLSDGAGPGHSKRTSYGSVSAVRKRRRMSADARRRISEAQKKRWAAVKKAAKR